MDKKDILSHMCFVEYEKHDYIGSIHKDIVVREMNRYKEEIDQLKKQLEEANRVIDFCSAEDLFTSNGEYDEWFKYNYADWFQHVAKKYLEKHKE